MLLAAALTAPAALRAQEAEPTGSATLDPITVTERPVDDDARSVVAQTSATGSKMTGDLLDQSSSVSVITAKEIEIRGARSLEDALSYTSGVMVNQFGGDDRYDFFRIRGFDQSTLGVFRDGLPVRGFGWTFARREPYGFDRIEVLKGSNSSLFGLNSPGGLVNAITKRPQEQPFGQVFTTFGDEHLQAGTDFGGTIDEAGEWRYRLTAMGQDAAYSYDYSNDDRIYLAGGLTWAPTAQTELTALVDFNRRDSVPGNGVPGGTNVDVDTFLGEPDFNTFDTRETTVGYLFSHDFGGGLSFAQDARYSALDLTYEQVYGAQADPSIDRSAFAVYSDSDQFVVDNRLQYDASFGIFDSRTLLGGEYSWIKVDEDVFYGTADWIDIDNPVRCGGGCVTLFPYLDWIPEQTTKAIYLQQELTIAKDWIATVGGRYDYVDVSIERPATGVTDDRVFEDFTKRAGLTWKITPEVSLYTNYSESFEPNVWSINEDPMEGEQYEVGVKFRPEGMNALFTLAAFDLTQTNVNTFVSPTVQRQIGEIGVRGIEFEAKAAITDQLNVIAGYSYWDAEIREDGIVGNEGNRPSRVPEHIASLWADYTVRGSAGIGDITLGAGVRYVGETYGDDENTTEIDAYAIVDASVSYAVTENVSVRVNANNLFDNEYLVTSYYGTEYYGEGRTVLATLEYRW